MFWWRSWSRVREVYSILCTSCNPKYAYYICGRKQNKICDDWSEHIASKDGPCMLHSRLYVAQWLPVSHRSQACSIEVQERQFVMWTFGEGSTGSWVPSPARTKESIHWALLDILHRHTCIWSHDLNRPVRLSSSFSIVSENLNILRMQLSTN
jgi:hypothetical protein